jgi:hypothetical protein
MPLLHVPRQLAQIAAACLFTLAAASANTAIAAPVDAAVTTPAGAGQLVAASQDRPGVATPAGWMATPLPQVRGHIQAPGTDDTAMVMFNDSLNLGGVVLVTFTPGGGYANIIKTFKFDEANPPQLTLLEPGDYMPLCHPGTPCEKVHSDNQVISMCFGEASCRILYFEGNQLHDIVTTD